MAGGAIMLLCCDRRYSTPGPWKIGLTEMSIGLQLPTLVVGLARVHLTPDRLQDALVEGRAYAPADAARVGFLHAVVEADAIDGVVQDAVAQLSKLDVTSYGITKRRVRDLYLGHDTESFAREVSAKLASLSMPS
jgi:enoyl-CoA hydratase/carnithine racemase